MHSAAMQPLGLQLHGLLTCAPVQPPSFPPCPQAKVAARNKSLEDLVQVGTVAGFLLG